MFRCLLPAALSLHTFWERLVTSCLHSPMCSSGQSNTPPKSFHLKAEQTQFSQHLLIHDVLQPTDPLSGLHCPQSNMPSSASDCSEHETSKILWDHFVELPFTISGGLEESVSDLPQQSSADFFAAVNLCVSDRKGGKQHRKIKT